VDTLGWAEPGEYSLGYLCPNDGHPPVDLGSPLALPPINRFPEDAQPRESHSIPHSLLPINILPDPDDQAPSSWVPSERFHYSRSIHMVHLAYLITVLQVRSKNVMLKICEIKNEKNTTLCQSTTAVNPAKRSAKRVRIELAMFNF